MTFSLRSTALSHAGYGLNNMLAWHGRAVGPSPMEKLSYRRHRFAGIVIQRAVCLYFPGAP
jgi:hypothetical protein